jgi:hypothetical protein
MANDAADALNNALNATGIKSSRERFGPIIIGANLAAC